MEQISNYVAPLEIGDVMRCGGIARVLESKSKKFKKGDIVTGQTCWQTHPILDAPQNESLFLLQNDAINADTKSY